MALLIKKITHSMRLCMLLCGALLIAAGCGGGAGSGDSVSRGASASLTWTAPTHNADGSPITNLAGYKVYYGNSSGNYTDTLDVGNVTSATIWGLTSGTTYYFAVTAYDDQSGIESGYSTEVFKDVL